MPRIDEMFAFIAEDGGPDDEGVLSVQVGRVHLPLIGADMARIDSLRGVARDIAHMSGKRVKLVRFSHREELEVISPEGSNGHVG